MRLSVLLILAALMLLPFASAQDHEHGSGDGMAVVLHDGPADGRAVVGSLTHFGFVLIGKDGAPAIHRNAQFEVRQDDALLFATEDTHEYDGILSFDVTFTRAGPYEVMAMSDKMEMGVFRGVAVLPAEGTPVPSIDFQRGADAPTGNVVTGALSILGAEGELLEHTDALLEFREKGTLKLASRMHLHIHDGPIEFRQALGPATDYVLRVTAYNAYPSEGGLDFRAVTNEFPLTVGRVAIPSLPANPGMVRALSPAGEKAEANGFTLYGMYDPQNQVGVGQPIRLAGVLMNESGHPQPHVDFSLLVKGPRGVVFESKSIHEYDGVVEYLFVPDAPGLYDATLVADADGEPVTVPYRFQVVPPVVPISGAGVGTVSVKGLDEVKAGGPTELTFRIAGPQGPVQHSEVDVTFWHEEEAAAYQFKLHTHASGDTRARVTLPHAGEWTLTVDPLPTVPQAVVFQGPRGPNQPIAFTMSVAANESMGLDEPGLDTTARQTVPGFAPVMAILTLAALGTLRQRR